MAVYVCTVLRGIDNGMHNQRDDSARPRIPTKLVLRGTDAQEVGSQKSVASKNTLDGCSFASCLHLVKYVIMMRISKAHIAGVGVAEAADASLLEPAIAAGTRALLDAGVTYSDLEQSIACFQDELRIPRQCFDAFGMEGAPCHEMSNSSGLFTAVQCIRSRQSNCILVIGLDTVSIH